MQLAPLTSISVSDRQRKDIAPAALAELKKSILSKGLLHPPVLTPNDDGFLLLVGERRLKAMQQLHEDGLDFYHNGEKVPSFQIPYSRIADLSPADLQEAELEENIIREPLTFLEECQAKAKIHEMRTAIAGKPVSVTSTARYIEEKKTGSKEIDPVQLNSSRVALTKALVVAKHADSKEVKAAKTTDQAYRAVLDRELTMFKSKLAKKATSSNDDYKLIHGDCTKVMDTLQKGSFDALFSDPPYGIDADTAKSTSKHFYSDDRDSALRIYYEIIAKGFHLCKPKASLLLWCDIDHFVVLRDYAAQQGWVCWRSPLIWHKGQQGHAPWGREGFIRTYESLLFAVKGQKGLYVPAGSDVFSPSTQGSARKKTHAAEKPVEVLRFLLSLITIPGEHILDPCCGSGSVFEAASKLSVKATGIELSEDYYNTAQARIGSIKTGEPAEDLLEDL